MNDRNSSQFQKIGSDAVVEEVPLKNTIAEYVQGNFSYWSDDDRMQWKNTENAKTIVWEENNFLFRIFYGGTTLTKDDLVAIANSLSPDVIHQRPIEENSELSQSSPSRILSLPEVEEQAGFKIFLPDELPEYFQLKEITFDPVTSIATVRYISPLTGNGLLFGQAQGSNALQPLSVGATYNPEDLSSSSIVPEFVAVVIKNAPGQYVEGTWSATECCGWQWDSTPYLKRLRWQAPDRLFELVYMGQPDQMGMDDMIKIAEHLN